MRGARILSALVIAVCIAMPLLESIDTWDDFSRDGNETEIHIVLATLCVGLAVSATRRIQAALSLSRVRGLFQAPSQLHQVRMCRLTLPPAVAQSPPALRI